MSALARVGLILSGVLLAGAPPASSATPATPASPAPSTPPATPASHGAPAAATTPAAAPEVPAAWLMPGFADGKLSPAQIEQQLPNAHPVNYYFYAEQLFQAGKKDEALQWFYAGQLRYRFLRKALPASESSGSDALFDSLQDEFGPPINHYGASDPQNWVKQIDAALQWDKSHPNGYTSKTGYPHQLHDAREGLMNFRAYILAHATELQKKAEATPAPRY